MALLVCIGALGWSAAARTAVAQGACVVCSEPAAIYRCLAEDATGAGVQDGDRAAQLLCITELARRNGHGSCLIRRDMTSGCDAPQQRVSIPAGVGGSAPGVATASQPSSPDGAPKPVAADPVARPADAPLPPANPDVPKTMVEVARKTADASDRELNKAGTAVTSSVKTAGDGLNKTGKAIGNAVSATFGCIVSLFKRCGE